MATQNFGGHSSGQPEHETLTTDRTKVWVIGIWLVITALMVPVAVEQMMWREFFVTQSALVVSVVGSILFLRK